MSERRYRWRVAIAVSLVLAGAGIWFVSPALLIAAIAPIGFVAYGAISSTSPSATAARLERTITPAQTYPGDTITVELAVTNDHDSQLLDLRVADGVPEDLAVVDGSPRAALNLDPGETATLVYQLRARYGEFDFRDVAVRTHSISASSTETVDRTAAGDVRVSASYDPDVYPIGEQTTGIAGELTTDRGGDGNEFHNIRSYQPGDPVSRINWRQYARTRELTTIEYRQQEAVEALVLVDARTQTQFASDDTAPTGTELSVYVASEVIGGLLQNNNRVGAAVLGVDGTDLGITDAANRRFAWVSPGSDRAVHARINSVLDAAAATARPAPDEQDSQRRDQPAAEAWTVADNTATSTDTKTGPATDTAADTSTNTDATTQASLEVIRRIHPRMQVLFVTPLCDDYPVELVRQLRSTGKSVNVYSPAVTARTTVGGQVATAQRSLRLTELRQLDVTVIDWYPEESLTAAFARSADRDVSLLSQP